MNWKIVFVLYSLFLLVSCSTKRLDDKQFDFVETDIFNYHSLLEATNKNAYSTLTRNFEDPMSKERASKFIPKADSLIKLREIIFEKLDSIEFAIHSDEGLINKEETQMLVFNFLRQHKMSISRLDRLIDLQLNRLKIKSFFDSSSLKYENVRRLFLSFKVEDCAVLFTLLKNKVLELEEILIQYYANDSSYFTCVDVSSYGFLVNQNSTILKPGDEIVILAAMNEYTNKYKPIFKIKEKLLEPNNTGWVEFRKLVEKTPGKYSIPVQATYSGFNGKIERRNIDVKYEVRDCQ